MHHYFFKNRIIFKVLSQYNGDKGGHLILFDGTFKNLRSQKAFRILPKRIKQHILRIFPHLPPLKFLDYKTLHFINPEREIILMSRAQELTRRKCILLARKVVHIAKSEKIRRFNLPLDQLSFSDTPLHGIVEFVVTNILMADFDSGRQYKPEPEGGWPRIDEVTLLIPPAHLAEVREAVKRGVVIGEEVNNCRIWANTPGGEITPRLLLSIAKEEGRRTGFSVKAVSRQQMKRLGMHGIVSVARGSKEPPYLIVMEYRGGKRRKKKERSKKRGAKLIVFVGKGVTFDTGGLHLKPAEHMNEMHLDMSGGAAVIAAMGVIARLRVKENVVGIVPAVENMPSGESYRPGDILKMMSGKTVEVGSPDAEGRLIVADAITYAKKMYQPSLIVDLATLTGAAVVALGQRASGLFVQPEQLESLAKEAGERSGDFVWPLPTWEEYLEDIRGTFAEIANVGKSRYGGAIHGAMFIWEFAKPTSWIHLDIAPTMTTIEGQFLAKGASGVGVRFLTELVQLSALREALEDIEQKRRREQASHV